MFSARGSPTLQGQWEDCEDARQSLHAEVGVLQVRLLSVVDICCFAQARQTGEFDLSMSCLVQARVHEIGSQLQEALDGKSRAEAAAASWEANASELKV